MCSNMFLFYKCNKKGDVHSGKCSAFVRDGPLLAKIEWNPDNKYEPKQ
jgi:hypothetical protein